jgi:hypothetical protein
LPFRAHLQRGIAADVGQQSQAYFTAPGEIPSMAALSIGRATLIAFGVLVMITAHLMATGPKSEHRSPAG